MDVIDVVNRLKELGSISSLSPSEKTEIEKLYNDVLDKKITRTSCSDCYHDAVIETMLYLKKHGKMKEKSEYKLKNGVLLQMEFGSSNFYTNDNLTNDIAEEYLAKYPDNANYFSKMPDDWQERVNNRGKAYDPQLLENVKLALEDGVSTDSILEEFITYKVNGRKVTKKLLNEYIKEASSIIVSEQKGEILEKDADDRGEGEKIEE
nr:MAG TPA: hypothetical protein [Caudoviricetes sp.]